MINFLIKKSLIFFIIFFLSACSSIPKNASNSCSIFEEKYLWYKHAKKTEQKWGTPVYLQLAIIKMESSFDRFAKPPRQNYLKYYLTNDPQVLLDIHKQLKEHGSNTKKKLETNLQQDQDLKIVSILLVGILIKPKKF